MFLKWNAGTENAFLSYAKALKQSGFEVINLVHPDAQIISKLQLQNLEYIKSKFLGRLGKYDWFAILYFKFIIKKHRINLVFAHQGRLISLFKKACGKDVRLIAVNHGHNPKHSLGADLAIVLNQNVFNQLSDLGQNQNKIALLPNGIDVDAEFCHKKIHQPFKIGSYGRFSFEKGYDVLIEALHILDKNSIAFEAVIGGAGEEEKKLTAMVNDFNLTRKIKFVGWVENKKEFFDQIDLFILPSRREEFGLTILEAINNSVPVLATNCAGPADIIKNDFNGFLVDLENANMMAKKIEFICKNNDLLPEVTSNAYKELEQNYSFVSFKEKLEKVIKDLTGF